MYQKCPVCDGTGLVSRPPWIAGDQIYWLSSSTASYSCKACLGVGILFIESSVTYAEDKFLSL